MDNQNKSIHEFDFNLICEYFSSIKRQGPGSIETTIKALSFIENISENTKILDIGCGTGSQTIDLAENTLATITAIDLFPKFIDILDKNIEKQNLRDRVITMVASMDNLPFSEEQFDVIWSEGAIYNIGFENGLNQWRKFLKTGGFIAVTEATWFTEERPKEINDFWNDAYPQIDTVSNKIDQIQKAGYIPVASFILPQKCWIENFYKQQEQIQNEFIEKYSENSTAKELIANQKHEAFLYNKYKEFYGYVFYIAKKI